MPNCPHPYDLQSLADGELRGPELTAAQEHVARCDDCAARIGELERLRVLLRAEVSEAPDGLSGRILELLQTTVKVRRLSCSEARLLASQYIDEELNQAERETLETHLFACEACYLEYVAMRSTVQTMRRTPRAVASEGLGARIMAAVAAEARQPARTARPVPARPLLWRRALVPVAAVCALALVAFGVFGVTRPPAGPVAPTTVAALPSVSSAGPVEEVPVSERPAPEATVAAAEEAAGGRPASDETDAAREVAKPPETILGARPAELRYSAGSERIPPMPRDARAAPDRETATRSVGATSGAHAAPRPVVVIVPPDVPAAPHSSGLGRSDRTPARVYTSGPAAPIAPLAAYASVAPPAPHTPVGVTASRPLGGGRAPESRYAELTRPEPRAVAPRVADSGGSGAQPELEETPSDLASARERVPRRPAEATSVYRGGDDAAERLAELSRSLRERPGTGTAADW